MFYVRKLESLCIRYYLKVCGRAEISTSGKLKQLNTMIKTGTTTAKNINIPGCISFLPNKT